MPWSYLWVLRPSARAALDEAGNRCRAESERPAHMDRAESTLMPVDPLAADTQSLSDLLNLEERVRRLRGAQGGLRAENGEELFPGHGNGYADGQAFSDEPERGSVLGRHRTT